MTNPNRLPVVNYLVSGWSWWVEDFVDIKRVKFINICSSIPTKGKLLCNKSAIEEYLFKDFNVCIILPCFTFDVR